MNGPVGVFVKHYFIPTYCPCCGERICFVTDSCTGDIVDVIPVKGIEEVMKNELFIWSKEEKN